MKRRHDFLISAVSLPIIAPLGVVAGLAVLLCDGRPALFCQSRVGRHRVPFIMFKLRTMRAGQVTRIGRVLRATGLDELPQVLNVLRGDMSLVGPRALTAADVTRLGWDTPHRDIRWTVRPGIVGPAQIYTALRCDARLSWVLDRHYVAHPSAARDLGLLAGAALCAVVGKQRAARFIFGPARRPR